LDGFLEVLCESAAAAEPGEGALDHPSSRQEFEALRLIGAFDDLKGPGADFAQSLLEFLAAVSAIGEDMAEPRVAMANVVQHGNGPVAILDIGTMDHEPDEMAECIGDDVPLAAFDFLASIEAPDAAAFRWWLIVFRRPRSRQS
jgi:hypothetical protein